MSNNNNNIRIPIRFCNADSYQAIQKRHRYENIPIPFKYDPLPAIWDQSNKMFKIISNTDILERNIAFGSNTILLRVSEKDRVYWMEFFCDSHPPIQKEKKKIKKEKKGKTKKEKGGKRFIIGK